MKANVGGMDRVLRAIIGVIFVGIGLLAGLASPWNMVALGAGAVAILTSLISFCPLYILLGINSCSVCSDSEH